MKRCGFFYSKELGLVNDLKVNKFKKTQNICTHSKSLKLLSFPPS